MEKIEIIGNVGFIEEKENSLRVTVAVRRREKNDMGEYEDAVQWYYLVADKSMKLLVGDMVFVRGSLRATCYLKNEIPKISLKIFVDDYKILWRKKEEN